ncbi:MAG: FAD-dependent oxidoreductase [Rhodospirillaceae bacterium]|nr:FAD-dependent oxidoreductase [Rhodospirillaceae bacterium]
MKSVLIVGGGIGGMSSAIRLREKGITVDIVDSDPEWRVYGAGITITGPTLRAFHTLGILDDVLAKGSGSKGGSRIFTPSGQSIGEIDEPALGSNIPPSGGIMRPVLHRILSSRTLALGTKVRLGLTVDALEENNGVDVKFSDGSAGHYDLVIGADGIFSRVRSLLFPDAPKPKFTGQGCWRIVADRPAHVDRPELYLGGDVKVGLNPCSATQMYLFALDAPRGNPWIEPKDWPQVLKLRLAGFGGTAGLVRDAITETSSIVYRPLEAMLLPPPWHKGHVILIGDAAHATTPHLASGAGIAVEDAVILADLLAQTGISIPAAFEAFMARRWERCRMVVENSLRLGEMEQNHESPADHQRLAEETVKALAQPI